MANEIQYIGNPSQTGETLTASVYDSGGVEEQTGVTLTETSTNAIWLGDFPTAITDADTYTVRIIDANSNVLGTGFIEWDGSAEVTEEEQINEIWQRLGLDADNPLTNTSSQIAVDDIDIKVTDDGTTVTLERQ